MHRTVCTIGGMRRAALASVIVLYGATVGACFWSPWREAKGHRRAGEESAGPAPIPASGEAMAVSGDMVKRRAWYGRNFLEGYKRVGRRNPKWDTAAEEFIRLSAGLVLGLPQGDPSDGVGRARKLVESGCDDPAVLFLAAETLASADKESRAAS